MAEPNGHAVLTLKEAAALLRVSTTTMYTLLRSKDRKHPKPPHMKVRGSFRFPKQKFLRWAGLTED